MFLKKKRALVTFSDKKRDAKITKDKKLSPSLQSFYHLHEAPERRKYFCCASCVTKAVQKEMIRD
jgi:hypothetical protein